jgi:hypothetical protein
MEMRNAYEILTGKPERRRSVRKHRCRWEDKVKWILKEPGVKLRTAFYWQRMLTSFVLL